MSKSNSEIEYIISENNINNYKEKRGYLLYLIRNINSKMGFNSQTFFLSLFLMDKIFSLKELQIENENDYMLYSLSCLTIASKFNENDPHIPDINTYIRVCAEMSKYQNVYSLEEIRKGEVYILNLLQFKLNFYSVYHFIVFFFAHGIILESTFQRIQSTNGNNFSYKKYLEKIYVLSREILDFLIEDNNNFENGIINNNYIIAAVILNFSIEKVLSTILDNDKENIFQNVYKIDINSDDYIKTLNTIQEIYNKKIQSKSPKSNSLSTNRNLNINTASNKKQLIGTYLDNQNTNKTPTKITLSPNHRIYIENGYYYQNNNDIKNNNDHNRYIRLNSSSDFKTYIPSLNSDSKLKITENYLNNKNDFNYIPLKKRASSSNKNEINPVYKVNNTTHIDELSNSNLDNIGFNSDTIKESSQLIRNEFLNTGSSFGRNYSKIGSLKIKSVTNFYKKIMPEDILDKTKAIFDKTNKQNNIRDTNYYIINNNSNIPNINGTGNTIIINNNININKYIDKKNIYEIYPSYNNYKLYNHLKNYDIKNNINNNIGGNQQRYGYFGTYYDYGYEPYKNSITATHGQSYYNNSYIQPKNKYGLYGNYGNYY